MAYVLWTRFLRHAPTQPDWFDRDRFVLSAGHASMLLYSLLHLTGYDLPLEELKRFRQLGSRTPGHPEYGLTPGVEATTGPLGQGFANAVGHGHRGAPAGGRVQPPRPRHRRPLDVRHLLRRRPPGGHRVGGSQPGRPPAPGQARVPVRRQPHPARRADVDGLERGRRWPGSTPTAGTPSASPTATTSTPSRRPSRAARADDRPSLIAVRTHIGYGSPNRQDSQKAHGAPLGAEEVRLTKEAYGWDPDRDLLRAGGGRWPTSARRRPRARRSSTSGRHGWPPTGRAPRAGRRAPPAHRGRAAGRLGPRPAGVCRRLGRPRHPQRLAAGAPGAQGHRCPSCSAAPPTCRRAT